MKRALISVFDKTGVVEFARELVSLGYEIISTGNTAKALTENNIPVIGISDVTGFAECLDGRVKTLHPNIHAGILAVRSNREHMEHLKSLGIETIDIVAVNLYPFKQTLARGADLDECVENIDIGGPAMIRAAAKNYTDVAVLVDPDDYGGVIAELKENGFISYENRLRLSAKVFEITANYDAMIAGYMRKQAGMQGFPDRLTLTYERAQDLRYGENPHQSAAFYREPYSCPGTLVEARQLHGKELSYNNISDASGALELLREFDKTTVVAVKHANPCGVASANTVYEAYRLAYEADPVSIFGGIVATNGIIDENTAIEMYKILEANKAFLEIILARGFTKEALGVLTQKKNVRLLELPGINRPLAPDALDMKKIPGGLLVQNIDNILLDMSEMKCVTERQPTQTETEDMLFAWKLVKHTKSNGIAIAKSDRSLGIGPGQVNRIWACRQAIERSGEAVKGAALASDAYFPFDDCAAAAAEAGITAIIQPGGSKNDQDSIDMCNKHGITMMFTGMRHFRH